jgi:predicted extracellular nuclease
MKKIFFVIAFPALCYWGCNKADSQIRADVRIMFYNTENFFDTEDDTTTNDNDFTPDGRLHWTPDKYTQKLTNIYKVIAGIGGWQPPEIIGFSEVENRKVLNDLLFETPLSKYQYNIVHYDSPDLRGIDVALLFRSDKCRLLSQEAIYIPFRTRNILLAKLLVANTDTLCVFVNHWPSRKGGEIESEDSRIQVASILRHKVDSLLNDNPEAKIVIMGDFNDEPNNASIVQTLKAQTSYNDITNSQLYNLSAKLAETSKIGTYNYMGQWQIYDQMIVSGSLLTPKHGLVTNVTDIHIYNAEFLLQTDDRYVGIKPIPTYSGIKYIGGFSDHLPVFLDLFLKN